MSRGLLLLNVVQRKIVRCRISPYVYSSPGFSSVSVADSADISSVVGKMTILLRFGATFLTDTRPDSHVLTPGLKSLK